MSLEAGLVDKLLPSELLDNKRYEIATTRFMVI